MNPELELKKGIKLLDPMMIRYGFKFVSSSKGSGSGGPFAAGFYEKGNRKLNFSVRFSLGCVMYSFKEREIEHSEYLRAIGSSGEYPGFSNKVEEGFKHLKHDLENFFKVFLDGSDSELENIYKFLELNPKKTGFGALPI